MSQDIESKLNELENKYINLVKDIQNLINIELFVRDNQVCEKDKLWLCEKCKFKLGVVDSMKKEVRIRYKDFYIWNTIGKDSELKMICRSCSHLNILSENDIIN